MTSHTLSVVILELGCGYNTPVVLRIPNELLAIKLGDRSTLIRVSFGECSFITALCVLGDQFLFSHQL
jgi:hypothetical protein